MKRAPRLWKPLIHTRFAVATVRMAYHRFWLQYHHRRLFAEWSRHPRGENQEPYSNLRSLHHHRKRLAIMAKFTAEYYQLMGRLASQLNMTPRKIQEYLDRARSFEAIHTDYESFHRKK